MQERFSWRPNEPDPTPNAWPWNNQAPEAEPNPRAHRSGLQGPNIFTEEVLRLYMEGADWDMIEHAINEDTDRLYRTIWLTMNKPGMVDPVDKEWIGNQPGRRNVQERIHLKHTVTEVTDSICARMQSIHQACTEAAQQDDIYVSEEWNWFHYTIKMVPMKNP